MSECLDLVVGLLAGGRRDDTVEGALGVGVGSGGGVGDGAADAVGLGHCCGWFGEMWQVKGEDLEAG